MNGRTAGVLTAEAIVAIAVDVADHVGLDAVSIRRIAAQLGVPPMSLYKHITSKEHLLDLMANELVGLSLLGPPPAGTWRRQLSVLARRSHATFVEHPWMVAVLARSPRPGPNAMLRGNELVRAVSGLGLAPSDACGLVDIVDDYVRGHALRIATLSVGRDLDGSVISSDSAKVPDDGFEAGLRAVLDGVERRLISTSTGTAPDRFLQLA